MLKFFYLDQEMKIFYMGIGKKLLHELLELGISEFVVNNMHKGALETHVRSMHQKLIRMRKRQNMT